MTEKPTPYGSLSDESHDAVHAARDAAQAVEVARQQQTDKAADAAAARMTENIGDILQTRIEHVLARGTEQDKSIILARVPYICQDIKNINRSLEIIQDMIRQNRSDRETEDKQNRVDSDAKYINQDQFSPFKWALITVAGALLTGLIGAILSVILKHSS